MYIQASVIIFNCLKYGLQVLVLVILAINCIVFHFSILSYHTIVEKCRSSYLSLIILYSVHVFVDVLIVWLMY